MSDAQLKSAFHQDYRTFPDLRISDVSICRSAEVTGKNF